jgi:hypothetical protein
MILQWTREREPSFGKREDFSIIELSIIFPIGNGISINV